MENAHSYTYVVEHSSMHTVEQGLVPFRRIGNRKARAAHTVPQRVQHSLQNTLKRTNFTSSALVPWRHSLGSRYSSLSRRIVSSRLDGYRIQ